MAAKRAHDDAIAHPGYPPATQYAKHARRPHHAPRRLELANSDSDQPQPRRRSEAAGPCCHGACIRNRPASTTAPHRHRGRSRNLSEAPAPRWHACRSCASRAARGPALPPRISTVGAPATAGDHGAGWAYGPPRPRLMPVAASAGGCFSFAARPRALAKQGMKRKTDDSTDFISPLSLVKWKRPRRAVLFAWRVLVRCASVVSSVRW